MPEYLINEKAIALKVYLHYGIMFLPLRLNINQSQGTEGHMRQRKSLPLSPPTSNVLVTPMPQFPKIYLYSQVKSPLLYKLNFIFYYISLSPFKKRYLIFIS